MKGSSLIPVSFLAAWLAARAVLGQPRHARLFDFGPDRAAAADGYMPVAASDAYTTERGYGWVAEENAARLAYLADLSNPQQIEKDAKIEKTGELFSKAYPGMMGAHPDGAEATVVFRFEFPTAIQTASVCDQHIVWLGKGNQMQLSVSADGQRWTALYNHRGAGRVFEFEKDLTELVRGGRQFHLKYEFRAGDKLRKANDPRGNALMMLAVRGTLARALPAGVDPAKYLVRITDGSLLDDAFRNGGDALTGDGVVVLGRAMFKSSLPAGAYFVEAVSNDARLALKTVGARFTGRKPLPWRLSGQGKDAVHTTGGLVHHQGGELAVEVESAGPPVRLMGLRFLPQDSPDKLAHWERGRLVVDAATDDPSVRQGLKALEDAGWALSPETARRTLEAFSGVKDASLRAALILLAAVSPAADRNDPSVKAASEALQTILKAEPNNVTVRLLLDGLDRLFLGDSRRAEQREAWDEIPSDSPLRPLVTFRRGRLLYHEKLEVRGKPEVADKLDVEMKPLLASALEAYANDPVVRMYNGERIPWGDEYRRGAERAPRWAALQRELLGRYLHVIAWWIEHRQLPNGDFFARAGQGLNDSVEMMRQWTTAVLALNDPKATATATKLADRVWHNDACKYGYTRVCWDIQHSSEEQSDTQPWLIGVHYGDPEYVERNLLALTLLRDVWTGVTPKGHRHFRSAWVSATEADTRNPQRCVDVPYAARAAKCGQWVAWYARLPEAAQLMNEWSAAWAEDAMRGERGKPVGVPPSAVAFDDEELGGRGPNWWDPHLGWSYFVWPGPALAYIYDQMLLSYLLTGDEKFCRPHRATLELLRRHPDAQEGQTTPGNEAWAAAKIQGYLVSGLSAWRGADALGSLEKWRQVSGDARFDDVLKRYGSPYQRYRLTGDLSHVDKGLEEALAEMRCNLPLMTSEVHYLDRVPLGGDAALFPMLTGQCGQRTYAPAYAVTWDDPGRDLAALVRQADSEQLALTVFSFDAQPRKMGLFLWRLKPGTYLLTQNRQQREVAIVERGQRVEIELPPQAETEIRLKAVRLDPAGDALRPDVAIAPRDIRLDPKQPSAGAKVRLTVTVHNIGAAAARDCRVRLYDESARVLAEATLGELSPPVGLQPSRKDAMLEFTMPAALPRTLRVQVSCSRAQVTSRNDAAIVGLARP